MKQPRLLIIEDQSDIRKLIRLTLDIGDYELHEADNGETGWHMVRAVRPAVVLLDVMMPGMLDGYQVCRKIKDDPDLAGTVVILLTARGQQSDVEAGRAAGADSYLIKPFSPLELIDTVDLALAKLR